MTSTVRGLMFCCLALAGLAAPALAGVPSPRNIPFPGVIALDVDVSDIERRIIRVREVIPVTGGSLTLLYPQWLPGHHAPRGQIEQLAGLVIEAGNGQRLPWHRDPLDVYAFHVEVPRGATALHIEFQVATPQSAEQGRVVFTAALLGLQWNQALLYPAGYYARDIVFDATLHLPAEWRHASALPVMGLSDPLHFVAATLETLVDSPVFAGRYTGSVELAPGAEVPVYLNIFADSAGDLAPTVGQLQAHRALVSEAYAALGKPHYRRYDFLLALSDQFGAIGLEHLRSSENVLGPGYFRAWDQAIEQRDLLAHEFTHAWNGKYRRPADLWTPNFNVPMQDGLLWVYEGMTQYYGMVLTARAGLWTQDFAREAFAAVAAVYDRKRPGRLWRPLADTTNQPIMSPRRPVAWLSWQRTEDYYSESALLWLGVDARLRQLTGGARGLGRCRHYLLRRGGTAGRGVDVPGQGRGQGAGGGRTGGLGGVSGCAHQRCRGAAGRPRARRAQARLRRAAQCLHQGRRAEPQGH